MDGVLSCVKLYSMIYTVECGDLSGPSNGHVSLNRFTATYNCNFGYSLEGDDTRNCLIDGSWSGSQPSCTLTTLITTVITIAVSVSLILTVVSVMLCYYGKKSSKHSIESVEMVETVEFTDRPRYIVYSLHDGACIILI